MEQLTIFCVTVDKIEEYRAELFDDSEVEEALCTMKQTSHTACMIASHMVAFLTNHITMVQDEDELRTLTFRWEYLTALDYKRDFTTKTKEDVEF